MKSDSCPPIKETDIITTENIARLYASTNNVLSYLLAPEIDKNHIEKHTYQSKDF